MERGAQQSQKSLSPMYQNRVNSTQFTLFKLIEPKDSNCFQFIMAIQKALQKQHDPPPSPTLQSRSTTPTPQIHAPVPSFEAPKGILANHEE